MRTFEVMGALVEFLPERERKRPSDDPIFALNREATQRRATGEKILNATVGALLEDDGTLAVMPTVVEALRSIPGVRGASYAPIAGATDFLQASIRDLLGNSPLASMAVAAATPGGTGALRHAMGTFLERGQTVLCPSIYWGPYATLADVSDRVLRTFNMFNEQGGFDVASMAKALDETAASQGRVLLVLNDPCNNPTGYSFSNAEWEAVRDAIDAVARRVPTTVLIDVAYLAFGRDRTTFLRYLEPLVERALVLFAWSASKGFAQYGARVGALLACTPDTAQRTMIQNALAYACRGVWSNCNHPGQLAVAKCVLEPELHARLETERARLRGLLEERVARFNQEAAGSHLRYPRYDGGFFVTIFTANVRETAERLKRRGVFLVPQGDALRVALCSVPAADVPALVQALREEVPTQ